MPAAIYDAQLLVSELVTNSLHHADLGPDASIRVAIELDDRSGVVRVEVPTRARASPRTLPRPSSRRLEEEACTWSSRSLDDGASRGAAPPSCGSNCRWAGLAGVGPRGRGISLSLTDQSFEG